MRAQALLLEGQLLSKAAAQASKKARCAGSSTRRDAPATKQVGSSRSGVDAPATKQVGSSWSGADAPATKQAFGSRCP